MNGTGIALVICARRQTVLRERTKFMKPIARTNDLVVKRDTGELYIEDVLNHNLIHLNPTSAYVWEKCDGSKNTMDIAVEMGSDLGVSVSERVIQMALNRLQGEKLLLV